VKEDELVSGREDQVREVAKMLEELRERILDVEVPRHRASFDDEFADLRIDVDRKLRTAQLALARISSVEPSRIGSEKLDGWREQVERAQDELLLIPGAHDVQYSLSRLEDEIFESYLDEIAREASAG
jgi:hypothetical protein